MGANSLSRSAQYLPGRVLSQGAISIHESLSSCLGEQGPKTAMKRHKKHVKWMVTKKKKLKNPINSRTGQRLKPSTLKSYASELEYFKQCIQDYKGVIQLYVFNGELGNAKTKARWIQQTTQRKKAIHHSFPS